MIHNINLQKQFRLAMYFLERLQFLKCFAELHFNYFPVSTLRYLDVFDVIPYFLEVHMGHATVSCIYVLIVKCSNNKATNAILQRILFDTNHLHCLLLFCSIIYHKLFLVIIIYS